jgi:hypothetical protein
MLEAAGRDISSQWQKALHDVFENHPAKMAELKGTSSV